MSEPDNKTVPATSRKAEVVPLGWAAFETLRHEIDRLFEDFRPFGGRWPTERPPFGGHTSRSPGGLEPRAGNGHGGEREGIRDHG